MHRPSHVRRRERHLRRIDRVERRLAATALGGLVVLVGVAAAALVHPGDQPTAVATAAAAGAATPAEAASAAGQAPPAVPAPEPTLPTSAPPEPPTPPGGPVTLAFGGDVHFEGMIRPRLLADPTSLLSGIAPVLGSADIAVVNVETAITEGGVAEPKEYTFRAPPMALDALQAAGVDVVSFANNHGLDFGVSGLEDSLTAAEARNLPVIGAGRDEASAYAPHVAEVNGRRIAIIGATQVLDDYAIDSWTAGPGKPGLASAKRVERLVEEVRAAEATADTVVVFLHWGIEKETCPSAAQQELARSLADAGADVIVGGHAHRLQGAGRMGDAFVAYGLGNFVFYSSSGPGTHSGVLTVTVDGDTVTGYDWIPAVLVNGLPTPLPADAAQQADADWDALRACTGLTP